MERQKLLYNARFTRHYEHSIRSWSSSKYTKLRILTPWLLTMGIVTYGVLYIRELGNLRTR